LGPYINQTIIDVEEENARISERIEKLYALSGLKYNPSINNYIY
jgi:hypothetical protein